MKIHKEGAVTILMALVFAVLLGGTSWYFGAPKVLYWILFLHTDGIRSILHLLLQGA